METMTHSSEKKKVVTYMTTLNEYICICPQCDARLTQAREWPRGQSGEEFATVSRGLHWASCDICQAARGHEVGTDD